MTGFAANTTRPIPERDTSHGSLRQGGTEAGRTLVPQLVGWVGHVAPAEESGDRRGGSSWEQVAV